MDFTHSERAQDLLQRLTQFHEQEVAPAEEPYLRELMELDDPWVVLPVLEELKAQATELGLWNLFLPDATVGAGLTNVEYAPLAEQMGRSIIASEVSNCNAPDTGNMEVLHRFGSDAQKDRWLTPLLAGEIRSAFCMTEPAPGAGSDPGLMRTRAEPAGGGWRIFGRKWFITGAGVATHFILIARTSDDPRRGLSAFLFHRDQPGWRIVRRVPIMGPEEHGGHCELEFDGLELPRENLLMSVGDGLKLTQIRLGTARLTHCMRWLGMARRSLEIAGAYVRARDSFGVKLADRESVQLKLAEAAMAIDIGRLLTMRAAVRLDTGDFARKQISMAKIYVADTLHLAVDTAVQLCGARGYSRDTVLEWMYRYARQARLVDGASEVHKMVVGRYVLDEGAGFWHWD